MPLSQLVLTVTVLAASAAVAEPHAIPGVSSAPSLAPRPLPELTPPPPPVNEPSAADFAQELKGKLLTWHFEFFRGAQVYQHGEPLLAGMAEDERLVAV